MGIRLSLDAVGRGVLGVDEGTLFGSSDLDQWLLLVPGGFAFRAEVGGAKQSSVVVSDSLDRFFFALSAGNSLVNNFSLLVPCLSQLICE